VAVAFMGPPGADRLQPTCRERTSRIQASFA
jgi:hypothetical protein